MNTIRHAPTGYACPFCLLATGQKSDDLYSVATDIVYRDESVIAFVAAKQWPSTPGHVLVVPTAHFENIYELPDSIAAHIHVTARKVALAMKTAYGCDGISTRQHNEPAGNQDVWHYHLHVYPRWKDDNLYAHRGNLMPPLERAQYAARLRTYLEQSDCESNEKDSDHA